MIVALKRVFWIIGFAADPSVNDDQIDSKVVGDLKQLEESEGMPCLLQNFGIRYVQF